MKKSKLASAYNFSQSLQFIILTLVLIAVSTVLVKVYSLTMKTSEEAKALSRCTAICENISEEFRADCSAYNNVDNLYFDINGYACPSDEAYYIAELSGKSENRLFTLDICVKHEEKEIYSLIVKEFDWGNGL